jgi:hypothetical protein
MDGWLSELINPIINKTLIEHKSDMKLPRSSSFEDKVTRMCHSERGPSWYVAPVGAGGRDSRGQIGFRPQCDTTQWQLY